MISVFVSYATDERCLVDKKIIHPLEEEGFSVWCAPEMFRNEWQPELLAALETSDWFVVALTPDSVASPWVRAEVAEAFNRFKIQRIVPVIIAPCATVNCHLQLPLIQNIDIQSWSNDDDHPLLEHLYSEAEIEQVDLAPGIASRELVFGIRPLKGQVFAIELLKKPILLRRKNETTFISINRNDVKHAVFTSAGREWIVKDAFPTPEDREKAERLDHDIHTFLLSDEESFPPIQQSNMRWASGGALSIVKYRRRLWIPFFFRDIPPYGWNISLGASENSNDNLNDPWSFILREFFEETLICCDDPDGPITRHRPIIFDRLAADEEITRADKFSKRHKSLRRERDSVQFGSGDPINARILPTRFQMMIEHDETAPTSIRDVLVSINITELGVEVAKIVTYRLHDDDYILDGELFEPAGTGQVELVRMPVALIACDYLSRVFANTHTYDFSEEDVSLPSVFVPEIPAEDIQIFEPDVIRRRDIACGQAENATSWETENYTRWIDRFGEHFFNEKCEPTNANACRLFTPASAKFVTYLFALVDEQKNGKLGIHLTP